jgi:hypothetical protein
MHRESLLDLERLDQVADEQLALVRIGFRQILKPPLNRRQVFNVRDAEESPLRFSLLDGNEEAAMFFGHHADKLFNRLLAREGAHRA